MKGPPSQGLVTHFGAFEFSNFHVPNSKYALSGSSDVQSPNLYFEHSNFHLPSFDVLVPSFPTFKLLEPDISNFRLSEFQIPNSKCSIFGFPNS